jgi:purine-nucleoside phosphorylase
MNYNDLLNSHFKYGTTKEDIIIRNGYEKIQENVVIAPWWSHDIFEGLNFNVEQVSERAYNFYQDDFSFTFLELKCVGAPAVMEFILSLGVTKCRNLVFLGSAGSLDDNIKIGDIVVPEYSICGDGTSRYLNKDLEDEFLKKEYPSKDFTNQLINLLKKEKIKYHHVPNFSIDTVFAQFYHIDKILEFGPKTIEMETANLFKCNELLKINVTALFCISDNTILNKSLYSGRTDEEREYRHKVRNEIIPKIVIELFKIQKDDVNI